jgi:ABC-type nitrate/sulfonate/bicarbonate transport system permease component
VAVVLGMAIGRVPWIAALLNPLIRFAMNLPAPALLPLVIVVFGFGLMGKFMLILFGVLWPILLNTMMGASEVDPVALRTARTLGLRRSTLLLRVLLPAASPAIFSGLRIGLSLSIILTVIAEMYTATNGVGHAIVAAQRVFDINGMWAGITVLALVGVGLNGAFTALERRLLAWQHGLRRSAAQT